MWPGERVWLERGSDVKGWGLWSAVAERDVLMEQREKREEKDFSLDERQVLEACSESLRSETRRLREKGCVWKQLLSRRDVFWRRANE